MVAILNTPQISVTSSPPVYDAYTSEFRQAMTFQSPFPLDAERMGGITDAAASLFRQALLMNGLDDFAWPPTLISMDGQPDRKSGVIVLGTRADRARPIILDA